MQRDIGEVSNAVPAIHAEGAIKQPIGELTQRRSLAVGAATTPAAHALAERCAAYVIEQFRLSGLKPVCCEVAVYHDFKHDLARGTVIADEWQHMRGAFFQGRAKATVGT